jgi:hypothetical protein
MAVGSERTVETKMKGIILAKYEDWTEKLLLKATYLRMIRAGRKFVLLKEMQHWNDLQ